MAPLMRHNKIALCAGHNEEIEKAAKYINDYDDLVSRILAMAQAVGNFPLAILYNHIVQMTEEMPETIISFVVLLFIANILLGSTWIKGVDRMSNKW